MAAKSGCAALHGSHRTLTPFPPYRTVVVIGSGEPLQSPLRPPGTDVKVGTESKGDGELPPSRWWSELTVIHTN